MEVEINTPVPNQPQGALSSVVSSTPMAANDYAQYLTQGNPDLVSKMAAINPNWSSMDINGISDLTMQASAGTPVTYGQQMAQQGTPLPAQQSQTVQQPTASFWNAPSVQTSTPSVQTSTPSVQTSTPSSTPAQAQPSFWTPPAVDNRPMITGSTPEEVLASRNALNTQMGYAPADPNAWAKEHVAMWSASPVGSTLDQYLPGWRSLDPTTLEKVGNIANMAQVDRGQLQNLIPYMEQSRANQPKVDLQQDADGNWFNANSAQSRAYMEEQLKADPSDPDGNNWVNEWNQGVKNGTVDPWAGRERVSWDEFSKGADFSGLSDTQALSLGSAAPSYVSALAKSNHLIDNQQDWSTIPGLTPQSVMRQQINQANTGLKAQASSAALQGLYSALQPNSGATPEQIAQLLSNSKLLEDSFGNAYETGGGGTQGWYDQISEALGGYDYAGEMAKMRATPYASREDASNRWNSALTNVANYLASPTRKLNAGALSQLAKNIGGYWGNASGAAQGMLDTQTMLKDIDAGPNTKQLY